MLFKPADSHLRWEGLVLCLWIGVVDLLLLQWILQRETDWLLFGLISLLVLSLVLLAHLAYRTWTAFTLEYWVDRNALTVKWADVRQTIPLAAIRRIVLGDTSTGAGSMAGWRLWPAPWVHAPDLGAVRTVEVRTGEGDASPRPVALASRPPAGWLVLETETRAFALSPQAAEPFIDALQERVRMGPATSTPYVYERRYDPVRLFTADRVGILLLTLGLLGGLLLFGALMVRYPALPDALAVRYTAAGAPEQVREKGTLFLLPAIGLMAWLVNGIWGLIMAARGRSEGAYLLWGGTLLVQVCAFLAMVGLIGWR